MSQSSRARIASIYWHMFSVGGVNTRLQYYKKTAIQEGDVFDILRSDPLITLGQERYKEPRRIRGGDTYIDIDGHVGHHPKHVKESLKFLHENYDALFFASLCPHKNRWYGFEPLFVPLFIETELPKAASISDGYWSTYSEWGRLVVKTLKILYTGCESYALPLRAEGIPVTVRPRPFFPAKIFPDKRSDEMLTVWT